MTEQFLTIFKTERFLQKWFQDVLDSVRNDGAIPWIIPTAGWGYDWQQSYSQPGLTIRSPSQIHFGYLLLNQPYP